MTEKRRNHVLSDWELDEVDRKMLQIMTNFPEAQVKQICKFSGITYGQYRKRIARPAFTRVLKQFAEETKDILLKGQRIAAQKLVELVSSNNPQVALRAIELLLNPILNPLGPTGASGAEEIIYQARIGPQGQLMQQVINVAAKANEDIEVTPE